MDNIKPDKIDFETELKYLEKEIPTMLELQKSRVDKLRKYVEENLSHLPAIKSALSRFGDLPIAAFIHTIESAVLPHKSNLKFVIEELCKGLGVNVEDVPAQVIEKICRYLEFFCEFVEELQKK